MNAPTTRAVSITAVVAAWLSLPSLASTTGEIAIPGMSQSGAWPTHGWIGLHCYDVHACELRQAKVTTTETTTTHLDESIQISTIESDLAFRAMFRQMGDVLVPGPVTTWYQPDGTRIPAETGTYQRLHKLGRLDLPWGAQPLVMARVVLAEGGRHRYILSDGKSRQVLLHRDGEGKYGGATTPSIIWAGDLDRDGKIDLLLNLSGDNCEREVRLYLSSKALKGGFVGLAAKLEDREPACGC